MKIRYKGFKGHDGDYDLGRACLVQGENDAGKSSLVAAVHFGLTGKLAAMRMGKGDTQDPGRLLKAIDDGGWAEVTINGATVRRTLQATEKKARVLCEFEGLEGKEAEAAAARLSGDLIFADFRRLVAAGDKERADILATYLPQPADSEKRRWALGQMICHMDAALRPQKGRGKKTVPALAGRMTKEEAVAAKGALMTLAEANNCADQVNAIFDAAKNMGDKAPEEMIAELRRTANLADDARKSAGKVAAEAAKATGDREAAKEIPALETQVNTLRAVQNQHQDAEEARQRWQKKIESLRSRIATIDGDLGEKKTEDHDVAAAEATQASAQEAVSEAQRGRPEPPDKDALRGLEERAKPLRDEIAKLLPLSLARAKTAHAEKAAQARLEALVEPQRPEGDIEAMRTERVGLLEDVARWKAEGIPLRDRRDSSEQGLCPLIGSACPTPEDLKKFVAKATTDLDTVSKRILSAKARTQELTSQIAALTAELEAYHAAQSVWARTHADASTALKTAKAAALEASRAAERLPELEEQLMPIDREIELLDEARNDHDEKFSVWAGDLGNADAALADAKAALAELRVVDVRIYELTTDASRLHAELEAEEKNEPAAAAAAGDEQGDLEALEQRLQDAHAAQARLEVLSRLDIDALTIEATLRKASHLGAAEGLMACVQAATEPICGKITEALHKMDVAGEFYVDLEARSFGIVENGKRIDVEVLGGGKAVLFAGAMLAALPASEAPRVLTLEGAELHPKWMARLLNGLDIEVFDASVVATCHGSSEIPDGWGDITMGV